MRGHARSPSVGRMSSAETAFAGARPWHTIAVLEPIAVRDRFGDDVNAAYDAITGLMQAALDRLAAERRWPVLG
jgi:hypothetical protein